MQGRSFPRSVGLWVAILAVGVGANDPQAIAQQPQWIWSAAQQQDIPPGDCFFRKVVNVSGPIESGEIQITADDGYELWVNGRPAGGGRNWRVLDVHDITRLLAPGRNVIAVKATNDEEGHAGLVARVIVKPAGGTHLVWPSDATWKTSLKQAPHWEKPAFVDEQWLAARAIGPLGVAKPWLDEVQLAGGGPTGRFQPHPQFRIDTAAAAEQTGSVLAFTFNEFGEIVAAREGGPLVLLRDLDGDSVFEVASTYCDRVKNCQGLLALNGRIFAVADGPEGAGLYVLSDTTADGTLDDARLLLKFSGAMSEHGPHAPVLGPDGLIYLVLGNHTRCEHPPQPHSPYRHPYEGDLLRPKYEDPRGHAAGIPAPGGVVLRTDPEGSFVETFAGGLRNAYAIAFNRQGELLTYDSDMEWDQGMPWYRPTRLLHLTAGSEFGWRSGWSKWPAYFFDSLPPLAETGRGSPTGIAVYEHMMFPIRYHNAVFVGDWARGRILMVRLKPAGGSYAAEVETFVEGKPLNVTGMEVGPDGGLYFATGGRGTEGGIYRITWRGQVPPEAMQLGQGIELALRHPQLPSAWARQRVALVQQQMGQQWDAELLALVENGEARPEQRCRALDLMQLFGPFPSSALLARLAADSNELVRAKAAYLMGIHADRITHAALVRLLADRDPHVQRAACEALVRARQPAPAAALAALLASPHRHVAFAAGRALQDVPVEQWKDLVLGAGEHRVFLQGALALLAVDTSRGHCEAVLARATTIMRGYVNDRDFLDLLRLIQVTLERGGYTAAEAAALGLILAEEYPSRDPRMNRELLRLLAFLDDSTVRERLLEQLRADLPQEDKMQAALMARFLSGWTSEQKLELLEFYERGRSLPGGHSMAGYIEAVSRDFFAAFSDQERMLVLSDGAKWPQSAVSVLAKLPPNPGSEMLAQLQRLDAQVAGVEGEAAAKLQIAIIAVLGRSDDPAAIAYLYDLFETQPARRSHIAMTLAQNPSQHARLLVRALPVLEGIFAQEVLMKLATVDYVPDEPEAARQVILRGLKLGEAGGNHAVAVLQRWTDQQLTPPDAPWNEALAAWQDWFRKAYPHLPPPELPRDSHTDRWTYDELLSLLTGPEAASGQADRGAAVFAKAQCAKCHRYGDLGDGIGPDLSTVSRRFQTKEILESILFPSQVISDQYASKTLLLTDGRVVSGMVIPAGTDAVTVLQASGEQISIARGDIEQTTASSKSAMPDGLLNPLTLEEILDLFAFLSTPPRESISSRRRP